MSPRAAWRLERLGFRAVYDYAAGKADWMAAGLPTVRSDTSQRRAIDVANRQPPTCRPDELAAQVAARADAAGVIVVTEEDVVLGRVTARQLHDGGNARVEEIMNPGPATVRAHEPLEPLLERMAGRGVGQILVTTPEGRLLGSVEAEPQA